MIRFCDKEVYAATLSDLTRGGLFIHFCKEGHSLDIIMVYDRDDHYLGFISYDLVLGSKSDKVEDYVEKECAISGENIFDDAKLFFVKYPQKIWLLVCNQNGEPECFAYNNYFSPNYDRIDTILETMEEYRELSNIKEIWSQVEEICIYGCNEWAWRLHRILGKWGGVKVRLLGEQWKLVYGKKFSQMIGDCPDYARMNVYAEGTQYFMSQKEANGIKFNSVYSVYSAFEFLVTMSIMNCHYRIKEFRKTLQGRVYICKFPSFKSLPVTHIEDCFRNRYVFPEPHEIVNELAYKELEKIHGMTPEKFMTYKKCFPEPHIQNGILMHTLRNRSNTIYLIGPCIVMGTGVLWENTLMRRVQELVDELKVDYAVKAVPYAHMDYKFLDRILKALPITSRDIIVFMEPLSELDYDRGGYDLDDEDLDLLELYKRRPENPPWFYDAPIHTTSSGNKAVAKEVFDNLLQKAILLLQQEELYWIQKGDMLSDKQKEELDEYIEIIKEKTTEISNNEKVGAIVMNCNPFTLGHQYLVEQASRQVDWLYIFVVQENRSTFPFEDRMKLVKAGVKKFSNVKVFPSGEFILSYATMPSYFLKVELQDTVIDASQDITIFARYIAPALNIAVRFVGEEPFDKVTQQYNEEMKRTLGYYKIDFVEIPRKEIKGEPISASLVRKLLEEKEWNKIAELVPKSTLHYLQGE